MVTRLEFTVFFFARSMAQKIGVLVMFDSMLESTVADQIYDFCQNRGYTYRQLFMKNSSDLDLVDVIEDLAACNKVLVMYFGGADITSMQTFGPDSSNISFSTILLEKVNSFKQCLVVVDFKPSFSYNQRNIIVCSPSEWDRQSDVITFLGINTLDKF